MEAMTLLIVPPPPSVTSTDPAGAPNSSHQQAWRVSRREAPAVFRRASNGGRATALPVALAAPAADGQVDGAQPLPAFQDRAEPGRVPHRQVVAQAVLPQGPEALRVLGLVDLDLGHPQGERVVLGHPAGVGTGLAFQVLRREYAAD